MICLDLNRDGIDEIDDHNHHHARESGLKSMTETLRGVSYYLVLKLILISMCLLIFLYSLLELQ